MRRSSRRRDLQGIVAPLVAARLVSRQLPGSSPPRAERVLRRLVKAYAREADSLTPRAGHLLQRKTFMAAVAEPQTVLIVEDNADNRVICRSFLEHHGYVVLEAISEAGVGRFLQRGPGTGC